MNNKVDIDRIPVGESRIISANLRMEAKPFRIKELILNEEDRAKIIWDTLFQRNEIWDMKKKVSLIETILTKLVM